MSESETQTEQIATTLAKRIGAQHCVCLWGDLGAGKSLFCRAMLRALTQNPALEVPSPTFTLLQTYDLPAPAFCAWHFDLYRLSDPTEVYELGWEEACANGIMLIEWPERLGPLLPARRIDVRLEIMPETSNHRRIMVERYEPSKAA